MVDKSGERFYEAELYRLNGELTLAQQSSLGPGQRRKIRSHKVTNPQSLTPYPQGEAEACFHKAIEVARPPAGEVTGAAATISLARLWQQQGKDTKLTRCYPKFTTGSPKDLTLRT